MYDSARQREPPAGSTVPEHSGRGRTWGYPPEAYRLGREARQAYLRYRSAHESARAGSPQTYHSCQKWDGSVDWRDPQVGQDREPISRHAPPVWLKIGELCREHQLEPQHLMRCLFCGLSCFLVAPQPGDILKHKDPVGLYRGALAELRLRFRYRLRSERMAYRRAREQWAVFVPGLAGGRLRQAVLYDAKNSLTPLFRYCQARRHRTPHDLEVCRRYFQAAALQYLADHDVYDHAWGRFVPESFRQRAHEELDGQTA